MAECVSCGKDIPPGKLFCDECYVKMKGRWGPRGGAAAPGRPPVGSGTEAVQHPPAGTAPEGSPPPAAEPAKRASGELTPVTAKKVVALKPEVEKGRGHGQEAPKRFAVTITLSEKSYDRIERMKNRLKRKKPEEAAGAGESETAPAEKPTKRARKHGPYGRPRLKAVESASRARKAKEGGRIMRMLEYRGRKWDRGDLIAAGMATAAVVLGLALSFAAWKRVDWVGEWTASQGVNGFDLGAPVYALLAVAFLAWLYMLACTLLARPLLKVDWGVVFFAAGIVVFALVLVALAQNNRILDIALQKVQRAAVNLPANPAVNRQTQVAGYLMVYLVALPLSVSGLVRFYERREKEEERS